MKVTLNNHDIIEAIREWATRRGIEIDKDSTFQMMALDFAHTIKEVELTITKITLPVKDSPYR